MSKYNFKAVELKWQKAWEKDHVFDVREEYDKPASYILEMFPYPSGKIHVGHARNYVLGDVLARYKRAKGEQVLHPIGWDAFGLPAENAAFKKGVHPEEWTHQNAKEMAENLKKLGFSFDWKRELFTCDPDYYRHEQKMFLLFLKQGLAYQKEAFVNWDPVENTVLANEQVINGCGWRSGAPVERKPLKQWFLKTTFFKEELLEGLDTLENWPEKVKLMQRNWIGRSEGARIFFKIQKTPSSNKQADQTNTENFLSNSSQSKEDFENHQVIEVFTTRPDTLFGATFIGLSPQHPLAKKWSEEDQNLASFIEACEKGGTSSAHLEKDEKRAFKTKQHVVHPFDKSRLIPIYVVNYVLMDYGTGAIFGCPAHDERDFQLAQKYTIPIIPVVKTLGETSLSGSSPLTSADVLKEPFVGDGVLTNSDFLDGLLVVDAKKRVIEVLEEKGAGRKEVTWRLRDWGVSRQRYWGCPIPVIYCDSCGMVPASEKDLPITLPQDVTFDQPGNPLDHHPTWKHTHCPSCGGEALRETDTLDTFFESSWYFLRFCSSHSKDAFDPKAVSHWMPVDHYIGGIEHAIMHLLYARFFTRALKHVGYKIDFDEPFKRLFNQGMVGHKTYRDEKGEWRYPSEVMRSKDGSLKTIEEGLVVQEGRLEKMSKSKCNVISIDQITEEMGADATRFFLLSDTPPEKDMEWTDEGIDGSWRYISKLMRLLTLHQECFFQDSETLENKECFDVLKPLVKSLDVKGKQLLKKTHQTIKDVTHDIESLHFNKYIARLYELTSVLSSFNPQSREEKLLMRHVWEVLIRLAAPAIPHAAEEMWEMLGHAPYIHQKPWPDVHLEFLEETTVELVIQINGKRRGSLKVTKGLSQAEAESLVLDQVFVKNKLDSQKPRRFIFVPDRLMNVVV